MELTGIRTELLSSHRRDRAQQGELGVARNKSIRSRTGNRLKAEKKEASSPRKGVIVKLTLSMLGRIGPRKANIKYVQASERDGNTNLNTVSEEYKSSSSSRN